MLGELKSVVKRDCFEQGFGQVAERFDDGRGHVFGFFAGHGDGPKQIVFAFDQGDNGAFLVGADDGVAFPMAVRFECVDFGGALLNADTVGDKGAFAVCAGSIASPFVSAAQVLGKRAPLGIVVYRQYRLFRD